MTDRARCWPGRTRASLGQETRVLKPPGTGSQARSIDWLPLVWPFDGGSDPHFRFALVRMLRPGLAPRDNAKRVAASTALLLSPRFLDLNQHSLQLPGAARDAGHRLPTQSP